MKRLAVLAAALALATGCATQIGEEPRPTGIQAATPASAPPPDDDHGHEHVSHDHFHNHESWHLDAATSLADRHIHPHVHDDHRPFDHDHHHEQR